MKVTCKICRCIIKTEGSWFPGQIILNNLDLRRSLTDTMYAVVIPSRVRTFHRENRPSSCFMHSTSIGS